MFILSVVIVVLVVVTFWVRAISGSKACDESMVCVEVAESVSTDIVVSTTSSIQENLGEYNADTTLVVDEEAVSEDFSEQHEDVTVLATDVAYNNSQDTTVLTIDIEQDNMSDIFTTSTITTEHEHSYVMTSSCMYHPEEGHYEKVCVVEGYSEDIFEYYDKYCYYCGTIMDDWGFEEILDHSSMHGAYGSYRLLVDSIWHEPVFEQVWIVDVEGYYEEEVVVECIDCGYIERSKYYGD